MSAPNPNSPRHVSRRDPLTIRRVPGNRSRITVLGIDRDLERVVEIKDHDRSAIGIKNGVGFRVTGDQNSSASLGGWHTSVSFRKLRRRHGRREEEEEKVKKMGKWRVNLKEFAFGTVTVKPTKTTITVMKGGLSYTIAGKADGVAAFFLNILFQGVVRLLTRGILLVIF